MKDENLIPVIVELNTLSANYHVYYQKLRSFHWNILGENFFDLHNKFEELYTDARTKIDEIAERVLTLRHHPMSKLSDYLEISEVKEVSPLKSDRDMVLEILKDHKILLNRMRIVIDKATSASDEGTVDLIGAYIREMEKSSWMLSAWTKETNESLKSDMVAS
jgi:starvation-inducible DNA-binding protein